MGRFSIIGDFYDDITALVSQYVTSDIVNYDPSVKICNAEASVVILRSLRAF